MLIKKCKHLIEVGSNQSQVLFSQQMKNCPSLKRLQQPHLQHRVTHLHAMGMSVLMLLLMPLLLLLPFQSVNGVGYSYTRFNGPVAGPERKILVNGDISSNAGHTQIRNSGAAHFDYVGKPEYEFAYGVEDADAHILHNRNEMRDGDAVKGVYSLIDPDGTLRVVKYTADEMNGFQAEVIRSAVPALHGQLQPDYIHAPTSNTVFNKNYNPVRSQTQAHFKGDRIVDHPPSNTYKSNVAQPPANNYETPPQLPIIYHHNNNYDYDVDVDVAGNDGDGDGDGDYSGRSNESEDQHPHYKDENQANQDHRPQYKVHEKPDEDTQENQDDDYGYKSNNHLKVASYKKKKQHLDEDGDDEEYDDVDDSEEVDDYDDAVHATHNSDESYEYY